MPILQGAFLIFIGSGAGGVLRWLISLGTRNWVSIFPVSTIIVNIIGSLLIFYIAKNVQNPSKVWYLLVIGFLGGFTTFSTFFLDFIRIESLTYSFVYLLFSLSPLIVLKVVTNVGS